MSSGMRIDPKGLPLPMQEQVAMALLEQQTGKKAMPDMEESTEVNQISFEERKRVYTKALIAYGDRVQMIVAMEELAECQKEICKILRGGENFPHLAEEIADATIMLEQVRLMFNINDKVSDYMDAKIRRLDERLGCTYDEM